MDGLGSTSGTDNTPSVVELIELCAVDPILFSQTFFPKTVRQLSPPFHNDIWRAIESDHRLINIQVFRGGAKTSILRMMTARRIAYGLAHTILYIGKSEGHAIRSVKWLRRQIEFNPLFANTFQLSPGNKWQDVESEINHGIDKYPIWIMAMGITGSVRGVNQDDFRPDLIVIDDVIDEDNAATPDQRNKISDLIMGALKESLAPASEMPDAKMVMLQTPLNKEDASAQAFEDEEWHSLRFGCFTPETADLPLEHQKSIWPVRWPDEVLRAEKRAAIKRNKLSLFLREKECKLISAETSTFKAEWLEYYELLPERHLMDVTMAIDPVPPPSEVQIAKGLRTKDYEALAVVGRYKSSYYLLEYIQNRGHEPDWTIAEFFRLARKWKPRKIAVEAVAYQRTLAWLLRQAMKSQRQYYVIEEVVDRRSKYDRISDDLSGITSNGAFYIKLEHTEFVSQFTAYPDVANDDLLEVVGVATRLLQQSYYEDDDIATDMDMQILDEEKSIPALVYSRGAP